MIRKLIILFLMYFKTYSCFQSYVNFDVSDENLMKKFPWIVTISGSDRTKSHVYGTLIHERAVLTLNQMNVDELYYFEFQVLAGCYNNSGSVFTYHCAEVRNVIEYHIIEDIETFYDDNLVILILSKPFTLSQTINTISFARSDEDYDHNNCIIMSLRYQINSQNHSQTATLFSPTSVEITYRHDEIYHDFYQISIDPNNGFKLTNDQNQIEEFIGNDLTGYVLDYVGSPLVCKSKQDNKRWLLVGETDFRIIFASNEFLFSGHGIRVDFNYIQRILEEILNNHIFSDMRHREPMLKYN